MKIFGALFLGGLLAGSCQSIALAEAAGSTVAADKQAAAHELAALAIQRTVETLGHPGGFFLTPRYHIALPKTLDPTIKILAANYSTELANAVERDVNHVAEAAAGPAGDYLLKALPTTKLPDPTEGASDAITTALKAQLGQGLKDAIHPVVTANMGQPEVQGRIRKMQGRYEQFAGGPMPAIDFDAYTLNQFVDMFFASVAYEEQNIRSRPSLRTTEGLKRLFSAK